MLQYAADEGMGADRIAIQGSADQLDCVIANGIEASDAVNALNKVLRAATEETHYTTIIHSHWKWKSNTAKTPNKKRFDLLIEVWTKYMEEFKDEKW